MTPSEELVYTLCQKTFLSLWSYPNPRGKDSGKELCDILVVCDPDVVIFSVKEIDYTPGENLEVANRRWRKRAIEKSAAQIYGAERMIRLTEAVVTADGDEGLSFPSDDRLRVHRVAVALGSKGQVSMYFGDLGKGFVHVLDEVSLDAILRELDTITDFVRYLRAKEELYGSGTETLFEGGEEDLLALYLHQGRAFPSEPDLIVVSEGLWDAFQQKDEVKRRKEADRVSHAWDDLIEWVLEAGGAEEKWLSDPRTTGEKCMRIMARETRFARRVLGKMLLEFLHLAKRREVRARIAPSPSGVLYVFLGMPQGADRKWRTAELAGRCWVARGLNQDSQTVVGIGLDQGSAHTVDLVCLHMPEWTDEYQNQLEMLQGEFGYFVNPRESRMSEEEYPNVEDE